MEPSGPIPNPFQSRFEIVQSEWMAGEGSLYTCKMSEVLCEGEGIIMANETGYTRCSSNGSDPGCPGRHSRASGSACAESKRAARSPIIALARKQISGRLADTSLCGGFGWICLRGGIFTPNRWHTIIFLPAQRYAYSNHFADADHQPDALQSPRRPPLPRLRQRAIRPPSQ